MIGITRLLCDGENYGDNLRYHASSATQQHGTSQGKGPVVVWNSTRTCNLKCRHCYSESDSQVYEGELSTQEGQTFLDDLADFKVPVILFSGGEPLLRPDFLDLAAYAVKRKIRATVSTNGTLIDAEKARLFKKIGLGYVGVSIDGIGESNDLFRGQKGAFETALRGIRACLSVGQKVGLRFTLNQYNIDDLEEIFYLLKEEKIPRVCFYHLVYSGRGSSMQDKDISYERTREALDLIMDKTITFNRKGFPLEVLTVDNHCDAVYVYLQALKRYPNKANQVLKLLLANGGNRSGIAIGEVDWFGDVHPDQFSRNHTFGNVKKQKFAEIWTNTQHPILAGLKNRKPLLKGRCAKCKWLEVCNGNFRARAEAVHEDFWAEDPACYLTNQEIGI